MSTKSLVRWLGFAWALSSAIVLLLGPLVPSITERCRASPPANPFLVPGDALALHAGAPLVAVATMVCLLAPGLVLVLAFGRSSGLSDALLKGFLVAFVVHAGIAAAIVTASGGDASEGAFRAALLGSGGLALGAAAAFSRRSEIDAVLAQDLRGRLAWLLGFPAAAVVALSPAIFLQEMNPDGHEMLSYGRSLSEHVLPRLPTGEASGLGLGMVAAAYPVRWFVALFGVTEPAARLPAVLYTALAFAAVLRLVECDGLRRLRAREVGALALGVLAVAATLAFNSTYHPYFADLASPAGIDLLDLVWLLGACCFLRTRETAWFTAFAVAAALTRPTTTLFLALLAVGTAVGDRPDLRRTLRSVAIALVACVATTFAYEFAARRLLGLGIVQPSGEALARVRYLTFTDWWRPLLVLGPCGVVPALALARPTRLDAGSRVLAVVCVLYTAFFHVTAFVALHHFAPAMLLLIAVWWRSCTAGSPRPLRDLAAAAGAAVALWAAVPRDFAVERTMHDLGARTLYRFGDYRGSYSDVRAAFDAKDALKALFPDYAAVEDPSRELVGAPWVHVRYAAGNREPGAAIDYVVQPSADAPPAGFERIADRDGASVFVRSREVWERDRRAAPPADCGGSRYLLPKEILLRLWGVPAGRYTVDLAELAARVR